MVDMDGVIVYIAHQLPHYICLCPDRETETTAQIQTRTIYHRELVIKILEGFEKQKGGDETLDFNSYRKPLLCLLLKKEGSVIQSSAIVESPFCPWI